MMTPATFAYKVEFNENSYKAGLPRPSSKEELFMALVRFLASKPVDAFGLKDDEVFYFKDPKTNLSYKITFGDIRL